MDHDGAHLNQSLIFRGASCKNIISFLIMSEITWKLHRKRCFERFTANNHISTDNVPEIGGLCWASTTTSLVIPETLSDEEDCCNIANLRTGNHVNIAGLRSRFRPWLLDQFVTASCGSLLPQLNYNVPNILQDSSSGRARGNLPLNTGIPS